MVIVNVIFVGALLFMFFCMRKKDKAHYSPSIIWQGISH